CYRDWSSDVCSSDLMRAPKITRLRTSLALWSVPNGWLHDGLILAIAVSSSSAAPASCADCDDALWTLMIVPVPDTLGAGGTTLRSEERRGGKGCISR